ncbi:acetoacetyl-coenzyme A synthetase [Amylibacter ulvae]|uniref:Acetoacetyl-coenzyme A synthetase n=1 Tax=Paramylibacter ulvae TaxID=1651968 RepID=A0ABQ3CZ48_9RHOB|nr:acetoacetate--CoA ligase [Amylibacter ulvae]GHA50794.1 acetoacetyl-coenzyme A synthetase [Amylibacter ulvae]
MTKQLWQPSDARIAASLTQKFINGLPDGAGDIPDYDALWEWSVNDMGAFWSAFWDFANIIGVKGDVAVENQSDVKNAKFFPNAKLNYAENLLRHTGANPAVVFHGENGDRLEWSWDELRAQTSRIQQALIKQGIGQGDRVAAFVPNTPYTLAAMLAVTSLGAVWSSCSPDFGYNGVMDRFGQIEPKLLFCADGYFYNGKEFSSVETAQKLGADIPSVQQVIITPYIATDLSAIDLGDKCTSLADFTASFEPKKIAFTRVEFNAPLFILFSSGTTGLPKCIIHSVGGTLLQHVKEHQLQGDIRDGDRVMYFTTCGWMMWNWLVSGLASGATLILFDGSPFYPDGNRLADIAQREKVTHFGTSAKYIDACAKGGITPATTHDLSDLRTIFSTGSPLAPEGFEYIYDAWKSDVCLSSIAGGTDIAACFTGGSPISPVYSGQCQKRQLGMNVRVFDDEGRETNGEPGELVCVGPHPSQPIGFFNDPMGEKYHNAYFAKFDNVWHHGDWVEITPEGGVVFFGRSDAVLNPGGVRIGTAEIYRQVERIDQVLEGLVIGQQWDNDVRVVLFVRLRDGVTLDDELAARIRKEIRANATPRHVPAKIIAVADIPRTKSGKITELAVRDVVHGRPVKNTEALANAEALELFKNLPELQD